MSEIEKNEIFNIDPLKRVKHNGKVRVYTISDLFGKRKVAEVDINPPFDRLEEASKRKR